MMREPTILDWIEGRYWKMKNWVSLYLVRPVFKLFGTRLNDYVTVINGEPVVVHAYQIGEYIHEAFRKKTK